jgi:regulator of PEP synthase PpsR (kinase-PPPase family)
MDLLGPLLRRMVKIWNVVPLFRPGIFKGINEESASLAESIRRELKYSQKIFRDIRGMKVLDVTNKSIEEISNEIMENGPY